jgi:hypothetical protein
MYCEYIAIFARGHRRRYRISSTSFRKHYLAKYAITATTNRSDNQMAPKPKINADHFSISGASDALQRTRRTITRALWGTNPDSVDHGVAKWAMRTIIDCVNRRTQAPILNNNTRGAQSDLAIEAEEAFAEFDFAMDALIKLKTVEERRAAGRKMGKDGLLANVCSTMLARDLADGLDDEHAHLRSENVWRLCLQGFKLHCEWTGLEAWPIFNAEEDA